MSTTSTVAVSVLLATAAAAAVTILSRPNAEPAPGGDPVAALQNEVAALRATQGELLARLDALAAAAPKPVAAPPVERVEAPRVTIEQVAPVVEAYLEKRAGAVPAAAGAAGTAAGFDLEQDWTRLAKANFWEDSSLWKRAHAAGRMDEVIAKYEAQAKAFPNDTGKQMELANAYIAYLQMDQTKWQLSMKADDVYDRVLDLDEKHWDARFSKAVSYTFWPDFLGKKKEAITHFETLVAQQETMPVQANHAETYLFLGNLLEQRDPARAKEVWAKGARRHPDHAELQKKLGR